MPLAPGAFRRIVLCCAMEGEAMPIIDALGLREARGTFAPLPMRWFEAPTDGPVALGLVLAGVDPKHGVDAIGTQPATLSAHFACTHGRADLVVNAGTAGGWRARGGAIGRVHVTGGPFRYHDRRVELPGFDRYARGEETLADPAPLADVVAQAGAILGGSITTGDALDHHDEDRRRMHANEAECKEMEAAAIAWICRLHGVPLLAIKSITDLVDGEHPPEEEFFANFERAVARLEAVTTMVVRALVEPS